ncbi:MAG: twin-arginine translocation signal domain-containing protein [Candidatus Gottesmanbacteria bacterium]|nr:twin-arginine translocation signal domain-containing protein [Candidatus Gottesmanbacteria bacterium]
MPKQELSRRDVLKGAGALLGAAVLGGLRIPKEFSAHTEAVNVPWNDGKYQTFPYQFVEIGRTMYPVFQDIDLGTLGPDVDTIFGLDFKGDIQTDAKVIYRPSGIATVTRVVGIKRTDLETVQFGRVLGGDRFDVSKMSEHGGDKALDDMALLHAKNTAHTHTKVVYVGDLGLFEKQWGPQEKQFLSTIIRAQRPGRPDLNIPDSNFVSPRIF